MNYKLQNKIKVLIYGPNISIEDADMSFDATFTDEKNPNVCNLKIYNLNESNTEAILNDTKYIEIFTNQYGLTDTNGQTLWQLAFSGIPKESTEIKKSKTKSKVKYHTPSIINASEEADTYIQIVIQEGDGRDIGKFVSKSYRAGFDVKKILTDIAKSIDFEIVFDKTITNYKLTYPIILHENARNCLTKLASYIGCKCIINNGRVYIIDKNPKDSAILFHFDESNIPQPNYREGKKIEFTAPYMATLNVGTFVKLTNIKKSIDGIFQICKIESLFSNYSEDCESKVTVKY